MSENTVVHLLAGGVGGTAGAVITCPLEVVKTRLQSSVASFNNSPVYVSTCTKQALPNVNFGTCSSDIAHASAAAQAGRHSSLSLYVCLRHIIQTEGAKALFKGLGPNLVGVAPSRAVYFCAYSQAKVFLNDTITPETPLVHLCSATCAGFAASTLTNPIWFIKTRLQLDQKRGRGLTTRECIQQIYAAHGIKGFYKGISASYYGIVETVIHFVIYEAIKAKLRDMKEKYENNNENGEEKSSLDFMQYMAAGATSKTIATCVAYPHEVARTRLRQEGDKYHGFWQTLRLVFTEEGTRGLYRGLVTQLVRQIPNTAIMMATYETVVYLCSSIVT